MNFKKFDIIIIAVISCLFGIFVVSQLYSSDRAKKIVQPENNEVLAIEVSNLTKTNASLRQEVQNLTHDYEIYNNSTINSTESYDKFKSDQARMDLINGLSGTTGQGVAIKINGRLTSPQIIDLVNALKNIGGELISINNVRLVVNTDLSVFAAKDIYEIKIIGNSKLLRSAIERKGGILDLISSNDVKVAVIEDERILINSGEPLKFKYSKKVSK